MKPTDELKSELERLTGQAAPFPVGLPQSASKLLGRGGSGIGYTQLNEFLLSLGYDRVTRSFFQYLSDGSLRYQHGASIPSLKKLREGVERFRKMAVLLFGNVKFAFKQLSIDNDELEGAVRQLARRPKGTFTKRHPPVQPIHVIPPEDTYYLGYLIAGELRKRLLANPRDRQAEELERRRLRIVEKGKRNHNAYLASDHLDVYIATSMRQKHEYMFVNRIAKEIFSHPLLRDMKLRWFDPTQAYCENRIDKGLAEALMLKRAACTIYLAQESDTFGKDSELASTLAQGKPVVAFIPECNKQYIDGIISDVLRMSSNGDAKELLLNYLKVSAPSVVLDDSEMIAWIKRPDVVDLETLKKKLYDVVKKLYDYRARTLRDTHPLGLQVNLSTGVANGVLVVRTVAKCAELVRRILSSTMEFSLDVGEETNGEYLYLREKVSDCVFRIVTGDAMLTNTFWNYYLHPAE